MPDQPKTWVSVSSADLSADIDPTGAQLSALRDVEGQDLLWNGNPAIWAGRAPLLFPIVGTLVGGQYRLGSRTYRLPRHGLARTRPFEIMASAGGSAAFRLTADDSTMEVYPFRFELDVEFEVRGSVLSITSTIRNQGSEDMPASFGYHPGLRWPLPYGQPRSEHFIRFDDTESATVRRLNPDGLLDPTLRETPVVAGRLALTDDLFREDVLIWDQVRSRSVLYGAARGPQLRVSYPDSPYLGMWSKPGADFVCIEPWRGVADPAGFSGDFRDKPGVFKVPPGGAVPIEMSIELCAG